MGSQIMVASFRRKSWSAYLGFLVALVPFLVSYSAISGLTNYPGSPLGSLLMFRSLFPYYSPPTAILWFIAFAIIGFFEDVEGKALSLAYGLVVVVALIELIPVLTNLPSDRAASLLFNLLLWPIGLIQQGEWGNLLALAGLMLFGSVVGNLAVHFLPKVEAVKPEISTPPKETAVTFNLFGKTHKLMLKPQEVEKLRQIAKEKAESEPRVCPNCNAKGKLVFLQSSNQYYCRACRKLVDRPKEGK